MTRYMLLNPIDYRTYYDKEIILDIKVELNDEKLVNVELQIDLQTDSIWWINRSLLYLCRLFDNLKSGEEYDRLLPSVQISIVTKDVFSDAEPEFYAHYLLKNVRTGHTYTGNFGLNVLYLNHLELATDSDKTNGLDYWARAFLATTWDELKSLAEHRPILKEVAESMYAVNADEHQRTIAEAHRKYIEVYNHFKKERDDAVADLNATKEELDSNKKELEASKRRIAELEAALSSKNEPS